MCSWGCQTPFSRQQHLIVQHTRLLGYSSTLTCCLQCGSYVHGRQHQRNQAQASFISQMESASATSPLVDGLQGQPSPPLPFTEKAGKGGIHNGHELHSNWLSWGPSNNRPTFSSSYFPDFNLGLIFETLSKLLNQTKFLPLQWS